MPDFLFAGQRDVNNGFIRKMIIAKHNVVIMVWENKEGNVLIQYVNIIRMRDNYRYHLRNKCLYM